MLYYQTVYEKPVSHGYTSRIPVSSYNHSLEVARLYNSKEFSDICRFKKFRYILTYDTIEELTQYEKYNDGSVKIYDLYGNKNSCAV